MSLLEASPVYKPFRYPWAYDAWLMQQRLHWLPEEVALADDVKDWNRNLTDGERNLLSQIFRFFTQADVRSEEHTSELQSLMRISYAVFCLKKIKTLLSSPFSRL